MNKPKAILIVAVTILLLSTAAQAYVPPELRTAPHMSDLEVVKVALAEHDAGRDTNWVTYTLDFYTIKMTNSGRTINNYYQLRQWVAKIEAQKSPGKGYVFIQPENSAGWQGPGSN